MFRAVRVHLCSVVCIRGGIARDKNLDPLALNLLDGPDIGFIVRDDKVHICNGAAFNKEIHAEFLMRRKANSASGHFDGCPAQCCDLRG